MRMQAAYAAGGETRIVDAKQRRQGPERVVPDTAGMSPAPDRRRGRDAPVGWGICSNTWHLLLNERRTTGDIDEVAAEDNSGCSM